MNIQHRAITKAPEKLVVNGNYNLGCFNTPVRDANLLDVNSTFPFTPAFLKYLQLREWQAFQIKNDDIFVLLALYNAKKMSLVQVIVYNMKTKQKYKYEKKLNFSFNAVVLPNTLYDSEAYYHDDDLKINVHHDLDNKKLDITVEVTNFADLPNLRAEFHGEHDTSRYQPMVVCNPFSSESVMYSHKCLMPCSGVLSIENSNNVVFTKELSTLIIDEHKGYYPYITKYDWVTSLGITADKKLIGFNLTDNQVIDQHQYNENCLWYDGELHPLPPIKFQRPDGHKGIWYVKDTFDMVNLEFHPVTHTSVHLNYLIACSQYEGPYGYFKGYLRKVNGEKVIVDEMFGMGEDFYLRL